MGPEVIERGIEHLLRIVAATGCRVIMDHHALRDGRARARFARLWETGRVTTAAGYLGVAETPLEARRAALWAQARRPAARVAGPRAMMTRGPAGRPAGRLARRGYAE